LRISTVRTGRECQNWIPIELQDHPGWPILCALCKGWVALQPQLEPPAGSLRLFVLGFGGGLAGVVVFAGSVTSFFIVTWARGAALAAFVSGEVSWHPEHFVGTAEFPAADAFGIVPGDFPATRYLCIFSKRFGTRPRIASKSSTLLNAPYDLRICRILSAVAGPMPGTCCNCAELMLIGCAGGFFDVAATVTTHSSSAATTDSGMHTRERRGANRTAIAKKYYQRYILIQQHRKRAP